MQSQLKVINNTNIYKYPQIIESNAKELTVGDLHANAILLLYTLIAYQVFVIDEEKYITLVDIYHDDDPDYVFFINVLNEHCLVNSNKHYLRFLGDEVCDRGQNDYFIFLILNKLHESNVGFEILLSNHGFEFVRTFETGIDKVWKSHYMKGETVQSLDALSDAIYNEEIENPKHLQEVIRRCYFPHLKLLAYSRDDDSIIVYSHAPINVLVIQSLARKFGIEVKYDTVTELANMIDQINGKFYQYIHSSKVYTLVNYDSITQFKNDILLFHMTDPVTFTIWNRNYRQLSAMLFKVDFSVHYVNGHDRHVTDTSSHTSLDGLLGKFIENSEGSFQAFESTSIFNNLCSQEDLSHDFKPSIEDLDFADANDKKHSKISVYPLTFFCPPGLDEIKTCESRKKFKCE